MRTVGQALREERERKFYKLEEIEKATKIRKELLEALEDGDYSKLPPPTFIQGFIKNYGKFLGLNTEKLLAIFRREFSEHKNPPRIMESFVSPVDKKHFRITPTKVISGVVSVLIITFIAYLWIEYRFLVGAPFLNVTQPQERAVVESDVIKVVGRSDPEAKVAVNNQEVQVDFSGNFTQEIKLFDSSSTITVTATNKSGKSTKVERTVFLKR